jgi:hypothetical protein
MKMKHRTVKEVQCWEGTCGRGRGNRGDEGMGIWLMGFIHIYEIAIALSGARSRSMGVDGGGDLTNVQCKAIQNWHNESPLYNEYCANKNEKTILNK